jgi:hypothetical protein
MLKKQMIHLALAALFPLVLAAGALADEGSGEIKCFPEGQSLIDVQGDQVVHKGIYTIPRKQMLLEITTATW